MRAVQIRHPKSGVTIKGTGIRPNEWIERGDVHDARNGLWEECSYAVGHLTPGDHVMWVRPDKK